MKKTILLALLMFAGFTARAKEIFIADSCNFTLLCGFKTISINSANCTKISAKLLIEGVVNPCCPHFFVKGMRIDNQKAGQQNSIEFCCFDVGKRVIVMLTAFSECDSSVFSSCTTEVTVQDKSEPVLYCPNDITVDCAIYNPSVIDTPLVYDGCLLGLSFKDSVNDDNICKSGITFRVWKAVDASGNIGTCTQKIMVVNKTSFSEANITWPSNITLYDCNGTYEPNQTGRPKFTFSGCARGASSFFNDEVSNLRKGGKCKIILRTWKVSDWCNFDPKVEGPVWTHVQAITLMDTIKPLINLCPKDTIIGNYGACTDSVLIKLDSVIATDCGGILRITNDSKSSFVKGANASGWYKNGVHKVVYTVYDSCGTSSTCSMNIIVKDRKPPILFLNYGLTTTVNNCPPMGIGVILKIEALISKLSDDCCIDKGKLSFFKDSVAKELWMSCDSIGERVVSVYAFDCGGNYTMVKVKVKIDDNHNLCPTNFKDTLKISGVCEMTNGDAVQEVQVSLINNSSMFCMDGKYLFDSLKAGVYEIIPIKDDEPLLGVTTADIVQIQRYVLNRGRFTSPYQRIAADVNNDGKITGTDITEIRRLILGLNQNFIKNWRFIPKSYIFPDPTNPKNYPEKVKISLNRNIDSVDFYCIKIGDVNGSAKFFTSLTSRGSDSSLDENEDELEAEFQENQRLIDLMEQGITIHPNPAKDYLVLEGVIFEQNLLLDIYNTNGKSVYREYYQSGGLDVSAFSPGMYLIKASTKSSVQVLKFIKE